MKTDDLEVFYFTYFSLGENVRSHHFFTLSSCRKEAFLHLSATSPVVEIICNKAGRSFVVETHQFN